MLFYGTPSAHGGKVNFCWWKVSSKTQGREADLSKTRRGFVKRDTDATQIFIGRHGKTDRFTTANGSQSDLAI